MEVYAYTDEVIDRLDAYARSIPPSPPPNYALVHPEVHVPPGFLPIQVTQFSRPDPFVRRPKHHWSIFVPTSPIEGIGQHYELAGDSRPRHARSTIDDYNPRRGLDRGGHTVGYVLPAMLPYLEAHFALVPVEVLKRFWNSQDWVCDALQGLDHPHMFVIRLTPEQLVTQMAIVSAAWEAGNIK